MEPLTPGRAPGARADTDPNAVATPDPNATPAACPMLTRWSSGIHNITDPLSKPADTAYVGGHVLVDSTPLFGGQACNNEHSNCGGRLCEPDEGGEWWLLEGGSPSQVRGDGYQFRIGPCRPATTAGACARRRGPRTRRACRSRCATTRAPRACSSSIPPPRSRARLRA